VLEAEEQSNGSSFSRHLITGSITAVAAIIVLLHFYAAVHPTSQNWGFHFLAFFPPYIKFGIPILMALLLVPSVQTSILHDIENAIGMFFRQPRSRKRGILLAVFGVIMVLFWVFRERIFLLGDGALILRDFARMSTIENIAGGYPNEPLPGLIMWKSWQLLSHWNLLPSDEFAVQWVSIACGGIAIILLFKIVGLLVRTTIEQTLMFLFLMSAGGIQLFFGYVENYAPLYAGLILFVWLSLLCLRGRMHLVFPSVTFGVLFAIHLSMLCMLPALAVVYFYACVKEKRWSEVPVSVFGMIVVTVCIFWLCGYSLTTFAQVMLNSGNHFLPFTHVTLPQQAYILFSVEHVLELGNLYMLLAPFAVLLLITVAVACRKSFFTIERSWLFLLAVAGSGTVFTFLANLDLGMSRDWDVLATYSFGVIAAAGFAWFEFISASTLKIRLMVLIVGISLLHVAIWVALNGNEEYSQARFEILPDHQTWGKTGLTDAYEELAIYFRDRVQLAPSVGYFRKYLDVDSGKARIWAELSLVYYLMGDTTEEIPANERAIALGTNNPEVYLVQSNVFMKLNRPDDAMAVARQGVEAIPNSAAIRSNMGFLLLRKNRPCAEALPYFDQAIAYDSSFAEAYYNAGICSYEMKDFPAAKRYLQRFLVLSPSAERAAMAQTVLDAIK